MLEGDKYYKKMQTWGWAGIWTQVCFTPSMLLTTQLHCLWFSDLLVITCWLASLSLLNCKFIWGRTFPINQFSFLAWSSVAGTESASSECLSSMWTNEWPHDNTWTCRKAVISQEAGQSWRLDSATNVSCYLRQVLEPIKFAEWEKIMIVFDFIVAWSWGLMRQCSETSASLRTRTHVIPRGMLTIQKASKDLVWRFQEGLVLQK